MKFSFSTLLLGTGLVLSLGACKKDKDDVTPAPTISAIAPNSGPIGSTVTITGTNLTGTTAVKFNTTAATTFAVVNATTVTATVPTGATTGNVSVTTPNGTATSAAAFTVSSTIQISAGNLATTTWTANNKYILNGFVYVPNGVVLTIEPGTIIKGDKASKGSLIVQRGGKLIANGTEAQPIVFTSNVAKGSRAAGDWGGIILCGKAPINLTGGSATIEGGPDAQYGGTDVNDNSGSLKYVRIEFAGIALTPNNEINGLTLGGVGAGTTLDHIQVSFGGDDAFEWFGGTVNAKYLVVSRTTDDMYDTDNGFAGKVQFALGIADPNISDQAGASNGFESDNDANASTNTPQTSAQFANVTLIGPQATTGATIPAGGNKFGQAALLRRNTAQSLYNVVLAGWPKGLTVDGPLSETNYSSGLLKTQGVVLSGIPTDKTFATATGSTFDVGQYYNSTLNLNNVTADNATLQLNANAFNLTATNAMPAAGSPLLDATKAAALPAGFEAAPFRGAFGTTNWTTGWTNFDPQNTDY